MNAVLTKIKFIGIILSASAFLINCGGKSSPPPSSSSSSSTSSSSSSGLTSIYGTPITLSQFYSAAHAGTYLAESTGTDKSNVGSFQYKNKSVISISLPSENEVTTDYCGESEKKTLEEIAKPDPDAVAECMGSYTETTYQKDDQTFYVVTKCNDLELDVTKLTRQPNRPLQNFGSLSIQSNNFPTLDAKNTLCGNVGTAIATQQIGNAVIAKPTFTLSFSTPYAGSSISATFTFVDSEAKTGIYSVRGIFDAPQPNSVQVTLTSAIFDKATNKPVALETINGSVTLTKIDAFSAAGNFTLEGDSGETFSGNFDLALPAN